MIEDMVGSHFKGDYLLVNTPATLKEIDGETISRLSGHRFLYGNFSVCSMILPVVKTHFINIPLTEKKLREMRFWLPFKLWVCVQITVLCGYELHTLITNYEFFTKIPSLFFIEGKYDLSSYQVFACRRGVSHFKFASNSILDFKAIQLSNRLFKIVEIVQIACNRH